MEPNCNMEGEETVIIRSAGQIDYCPYCGRETEREEKPVGSVMVDGEEHVTKTNLEVSCPQHGVLIVAP